VLVVDDDADTLEMVRFALDLHGIQSEGAATGNETLRMVSEMSPDAILLDMGLPDMTGYDVCRQLRDNPATRSTPILAVTGHAMPTDVQQAFDSGCNSVLLKPCELDTLLAELQRHLPMHSWPMAS
jgi:CheY-like chemotaxis protein